MKPEIKEAWLGALRSGKYNQAQKRLRTHEGHCCIGVLACVLKEQFPDIVDDYFIVDDSIDLNITSKKDADVSTWSDLPKAIYDKIELDSNLASVFIRMNDGYNTKNHTFEEIAVEIEAKA